MSLNRGQLRANVRINLGDTIGTFYSDQEINDSMQDGYNEIAALALYNVKKVTLTWVAKTNYFDFAGALFNVTDYIGTIAIFNNNTNQYLRDDIGWRDFDRLRRNWERWRGTPQFWCPHSLQYIAIAPAYAAVPGGVHTFVLYYYGQSTVLANDGDTPILASDMGDLLEYYATADLLETAGEFQKAGPWWTKYLSQLMNYKERCHKLAAYELLLRV